MFGGMVFGAGIGVVVSIGVSVAKNFSITILKIMNKSQKTESQFSKMKKASKVSYKINKIHTYISKLTKYQEYIHTSVNTYTTLTKKHLNLNKNY